MNDPKKPEVGSSQMLPPVEIRRGAYARLTLCEVEKSELELLAQGSPDSLYLNFAIFLLSVALTALVALFTLPTDKTSTVSPTFVVFVVITVLGFIVGAFLLLLWLKKRKSVSVLVREIKSRLPREGIQELSPLPDENTEE
jgi:hypothetical protein